MPALEITGLNDYAVLWAASSTDQYGRFKVSEPVEIRVRWDGSQVESTDPNNTVQAQPAEVLVDRVITVDSILWHGKLRDLPAVPTNLAKVIGYEAVPDIRNKFIQRTVTLMRYNDSLPTVV
jgi:hypothetical protein